MRKNLSNLLKIGITVVGLAIVLSQIDLQQVWQSLINAEVSWVVAGFILATASLSVRAFRWLLLLRGLGIQIRFSRLNELYFVGNFFNAFLPSGFGGDVVRVLEIAREVPASTAAGTVILDRLTGLIMLFVMALLSMPFRPDSFSANFSWVIIIGSLGGIIGGFILMEGSLIRRFGRRLPGPLSPTGDTAVARLLQAVQGCGWKAIWQALAVSVGFNLILACWWLTSGLALGVTVTFSYYVLIMPILSVPLLLPSISGLGPRELLAPTLFAMVGVSPEIAVSVSLLVFIITRLTGLLGAPVYVYSTMRDGRANRKSDRALENDRL